MSDPGVVRWQGPVLVGAVVLALVAGLTVAVTSRESAGIVAEIQRRQAVEAAVIDLRSQANSTTMQVLGRLVTGVRASIPDEGDGLAVARDRMARVRLLLASDAGGMNPIAAIDDAFQRRVDMLSAILGRLDEGRPDLAREVVASSAWARSLDDLRVATRTVLHREQDAQLGLASRLQALARWTVGALALLLASLSLALVVVFLLARSRVREQERTAAEARALEAAVAVNSRLAALGTLVAGVGHEINNPLAAQMASQGFARDVVEALLVRVRSGKPLPPAEEERELREAVDALRDALVGSQRIARIVRDLVAFGRSDVRKERIHLRDAVDAGIRWVPASAGGDVTIEVEDHGAPDVRGVPGQLAQVVLNLVLNACQSARDGRRPSVKVTLGPGGPGMARLEVTDDGAGIPPEVLGRIFDPFFTTRRVGQGSGLGLSICHAIVTGHGGTITASSVPGKGATFRVDLPAA